MTRSEILQIAKPILFNTEEVLATLDGRKTATRRVIRPQPWCDYPRDCGCLSWDNGKVSGSCPSHCMSIPNSPYKPGDYLYVRETWGIGNLFYDDEDIPNLCVCYKASEDRIEETCTTFKITDERYEKYDNRMMSMQDWYSCVSMPKEAARIFLRVTDVRAERLKDITEEGAKYEGANYRNGKNVGWEEKMRRTAIERFAEIWDSTIKPKDRDKYGWAANPYVFVISFERVEAQE